MRRTVQQSLFVKPDFPVRFRVWGCPIPIGRLLPSWQRVFAASMFVMVALGGSHPALAGSCDLFTKSFKKGTGLSISDWAGRAGGNSFLSLTASNDDITLVDQAIVVPDDTENDVQTVQWRVAGQTIAVNGKAGLTEAISLNEADLGADQRKKLFSHLDLDASLPSWVILEDGDDNLFRLDLTGRPVLQKALLDARFKSLEIASGTVLEFKRLDVEAKRAVIRFKSEQPEAALGFNAFYETEFALPSNLTLQMVPSDLAKSRSLTVVNSLRAVERTSVDLVATQGRTAFDSLVFRGCMAKRQFDSQDAPLPDSQLNWVGIDTIIVRSKTTGEAQISAVIPPMPPQHKWYTRPFYSLRDTLGHIFLDNRDNTRIRIVAADANGIKYFGVTDHFVDSRSLAVVIAGAAFGFAYLLPFLLWRRSGKVGESLGPLPNRTYSLLRLVRGRNGSASISNLQIWWWTVAVFALIVFVWVATGGLASFNQSIMILLGVTTGGSLAAKAVAINLRDSSQTIVSLQGNTEQVQATWWDLIAAGEQVSLTKLQMLVFTIFTGLYVVATVIGQLKFPDIPPELLTLMGISNGVYVLGKATSSNLYVQLAGLQVKRQSIDEQIRANEKRKAALRNEKDALRARAFDDEGEKKLAALEEEKSKNDKQIEKLLAGVAEADLSEENKKKHAELIAAGTDIDNKIEAMWRAASTAKLGAEDKTRLDAIEAELGSIDTSVLAEAATELKGKIEAVKKLIEEQKTAAAGAV